MTKDEFAICEQLRSLTPDAATPEDALGFVTQDVRTAVRRLEDELKAAA